MPTVYFDSGGAATNSGTSDNASPDLSGTGTATVVANTTFVDANVTVATNQIAVTAHGYTAGTGVELTSSGTLPAGLTLTTLYFIGVVDANTITLHRFIADAIAGANAVDITAAAGGGTHTINNMTLNIAGGVDLSGVKCSACRVTTTGTSHVFTMLGGIHGFTTGDPIVLDVSTGGTAPTGTTMGASYYVNALSSTTFRIYGHPAAAIAGGASGVNVSAAEVRTLHARSLRRDNGGQQSAINLPASTVTTREIFWIRAIDNTNDLIVLDVVVTGLGAGANWAIGGQLNAAGWADAMNTIRNNDTVWINTDLSANPLNGVIRGFGAGFNTSGGFIRFIGKAGARRIIANQGNGTLLDFNHAGSTVGLNMSNLELQSQGTGTTVTRTAGTVQCVIDNVRFTDSGATQLGIGNNTALINCEITGTSAGPGSPIESIQHLIDCYVHDNTSTILVWRAQTGFAAGSSFCVNTIFERNTGAHVGGQGNDNAQFFIGSTFYRSDASGLGRSNTESRCALVLLRTIWKDNGNAASEYNWSLVANPAGTDGFGGYVGVLVERDNVISIAGARGGTNTNLMFTLDASDLTSDPLFTDPDNVSAADRDFSLQAGSPALIPFSFPGSDIEYTYAIGAVQNQGESGGTIDANVTHVNGIEVGGTGALGDEWGPVGASATPTDVNVVSVNGVLVTGTGAPGDEWGPA